MIIRTNMPALRTFRESAKTGRAMAKNLEKLSSGYRINRSADDASGLAVSERMRFNITELQRCHSNAQEGVNLAKTADGALAEVNDMLRRARELCIRAENGTYSQQELASISDEMNQLFSEIDRITEASRFNEIQLFRGKAGPDFHYEYDETFSPVDGDPAEWGEMDFVQTEKFDEPPEAKAATVTFKLDDGIDFADVNSLNGRTIQVGNYTYYFTDGTVDVPGNYTDSIINLKAYGTTEAALKKFAQDAVNNNAQRVTSIVIDKDARTITMTAPLRELNAGSFEADGMTLPNKDPKGNGAWANGTVAAQNLAGNASLDQVDGQGIANNTPFYSDTATAYISLSGVHNTLDSNDVNNLMKNSLYISGRTLYLNTLSPTVGMSRDTLGSNLATAISGLGDNYEATYDSSLKRVTVTLKNQSTTSGSAGLISENRVGSTGHTENHTMFTSSALNFNFNVTTQASGERPEVCVVTVPQPSAPFSFSVNGTNYLYYDSSKNSLRQPGDTSTSYNPYTYNIIDVNGRDQAWIINNIAEKIRSQTGGGSVQINGNQITATAGSLNAPMNLSSKLKGVSITVTSSKDVIDTPGTDAVFTRSSISFQKIVTVPFTLGAEEDISKLVGSGFGIGDVKFEFTDGTSLRSDYEDINISGCTTFDQLKEKVQQVLGSAYTVELDQTNADNTKLLISKRTSSNIAVTDGVTGIKGLISGSEPVKYADGTDTGYSQKAIDFSSVNSDNLNDLLGKGFRINCATCEGEYINVFFCWENDGRAPESFEIEYNGEKRTIHNIAVELSKVAGGDQIVQSIVDQVRPTLKHFTDVAVGSPPTMLLAKEKRIGDVKENGVSKRGEVQTGLKTNFNYSVNIRKVEDYPEDGSVDMKNTEVEIYVGSEPDPQIIPIRLPYIDLKTLRLRPPETVDLNDSDQNASDWLSRVDQANLAISKARGVIGADHNRLEYAVQSLSHSRENLTDAESLIRDTDMAEEMMTHVKLQILTQAQQSMLAQACSQPQQVLRLIS